MKNLEFGDVMKRLERITPERQRIAKIFKTYVEKAVDELDVATLSICRETFTTHLYA